MSNNAFSVWVYLHVLLSLYAVTHNIYLGKSQDLRWRKYKEGRSGTSGGSWVGIREDFVEEVMFRLKPDK